MPAKKEKGPERKKEAKFEFGLGELSFGGLFKSLGDLIETVSKVAESGEAISKAGEIKGLGEGIKGVYGVTIRTLGGKPVVESFGNIRETPKGPVVEEAREPLVDVFDEKDHIRVIAEMPGVDKDDIRIRLEKDRLHIGAETGERKFSKEVTLPAPVDPSTLASSYRNGVMEIKVKKAGAG